MKARPNAISIVAWFMVIVGAIGVMTNGYNYLVVAPRFSPTLWLTFVVLKAIGLIAGILLLRMQRAGVWLFAGSFLASMVIAVGTTGPYSQLQWAGGGFIAAALAAAVWLAVRRHWKELRPMRGLRHA